jgi:hypothetical protein
MQPPRKKLIFTLLNKTPRAVEVYFARNSEHIYGSEI